MPDPERLYCVTVRVVDLVWATSEEDAVSQLSQAISGNRYLDVDVVDGVAVVSDPVEHMAWDGEKRVQTNDEAAGDGNG